MKVNVHQQVSKHVKKISGVLLTTMLLELLMPLKALALTSGPSQPEFQGFSPLATTSLVDPFSGDFSYNIPLLEIDGYPLNLVYRATSNIEEEASWVGYGWNVNVGTLNRMVRGLPDDMNGEQIKSYQNVRTRKVNTMGASIEPKVSFNAGITDRVSASAGVQASFGFTKDEDNYTGKAIGLSIGGGVFAGVNAGPFNASASAGVTLSANSAAGGSITTYAGFNAGVAMNDYVSAGFGKSVTRTFNTISGWHPPNMVGSFNISSITREIQKDFVNSISNDIPRVTIPYSYVSNGTTYKLDLGVNIGVIDKLGIDLGVAFSITENYGETNYNKTDVHKGYGYMYAENAKAEDLLDFTRDNDGGINKDMPFMPPAMKTYDVFSSTAHNASKVFRADRNDFGTVRDPRVYFQNTKMDNKYHELQIKAHVQLSCWVGVSVAYYNTKTSTEGHVSSGGNGGDMQPYRNNTGKDQNLLFRVCGSPSMFDSSYLSQVNSYNHYGQNKNHIVKGASGSRRPVTSEPIAVFTNSDISAFPKMVIPKSLEAYDTLQFPCNKPGITSSVSRGSGSKIGAIMNTNKSGQIYVYATPVNNHIKYETAFRVDGFATNNFQENLGLMTYNSNDAKPSNQQVRDYLYKSTVSPEYATSYLLNAVLSPDYVDVTNNGISDDDMGSYVKFNYSKTEGDYRWRIPYGDVGQNTALLNRGVKLTKFDDMGSYSAGSKDLWYAHSIESKNHVAEFYVHNREDAKDSRSKIMDSNHPHQAGYTNDKPTYSHMKKLDSIKYYDKHDRFINKNNAIPLKTIYFEYDYGISSQLPNSTNDTGKLRLVKVRVRHGNEPMKFAETYDFGYVNNNPAYSIGDKDGWGNYYPNTRTLPLCEFPYIDQENRANKDIIASSFHMNHIGLPSGGKIDVEYEADDYLYVQNKRAMALMQVEGVGLTSRRVSTDVYGLYAMPQLPFQYIYVKKPVGMTSVSKSTLLNNSNLMYFSFNINIGGNAFSTYDQVKGYAEVESVGLCQGESDYIYIKVKPVKLTGTYARPSPMVNSAINMARAYASDQLYFQEAEHPNGKNQNHAARLLKAANQVADAVFGKNSIAELMKDYKAGHRYDRTKSFVRLAMGQPKIGGGSRVSKLTFDDEWSSMIPGESPSLIGYKYIYTDKDGVPSGVASYEPLVGGEENPFRSGHSYSLSNNKSKYPPYDPIEMIKEDPVGESFFPTGSVGYGSVIIESIHKGYARSAQSRMIQEFYTAKDFPYFSSYTPKKVVDVMDEDYPDLTLRDVLLSFIGVSNTKSSSANIYEVTQNFLIETNDMHGKTKANYNYRIMPKTGKEELISSTEYFYHSGGNKLSNDVPVIEYKSVPASVDSNCREFEKEFPRANMEVRTRTLGVDVDVCTDSRDVVSSERRQMKKRGGGVKVCIPPSIIPKFTWTDAVHEHTDYFKSNTTTKIVNRYGLLKSVRNYKEGAETIIENKYYDAVTGEPVVQVVKDKYSDNIYSTTIPAYWTRTDLEPSYLGYPYMGEAAEALSTTTLNFTEVSGPYLAGYKMIESSFEVHDDLYHPGDELFVQGYSTKTNTLDWHRLYVTNVLVQKFNHADPDPLSSRYGGQSDNTTRYVVYLSPHKMQNLSSQDFGNGDGLYDIQKVFKYRSGRKNMLNVSAGNYQTLVDPITAVLSSSVNIGLYSDLYYCYAPSYMLPVINASATSYEGTMSAPDTSRGFSALNPVSSGVVNQPYLSGTYTLFGNRETGNIQSQRGNYVTQQRGAGLINQWYYWLPNRYDSAYYGQQKAMLTHYGSQGFKTSTAIDSATNKANAFWVDATQVTKSIPGLGPVEEKNPLNVYNSIFVTPTSQKIMHVTANGKFGQTWVETFEDYRQLLTINDATDFVFSPFKQHMTLAPAPPTNYELYNMSQSVSSGDLTGTFTIDSSTAHSGIYSLNVTGGSSTIVKVTPKKYLNQGLYSTVFDFNLNDSADQKFTYEVWVKGGSSITAPSVTISGNKKDLVAVSNTIDGWTQYRTRLDVTSNIQVTFEFPSGQHYDDIRVFPSEANVKTYAYHPFKGYLMAIMDEQNYATFYEYNNRNQLVRLKKETEKGVITITENIKNSIAR